MTSPEFGPALEIQSGIAATNYVTITYYEECTISPESIHCSDWI